MAPIGFLSIRNWPKWLFQYKILQTPDLDHEETMHSACHYITQCFILSVSLMGHIREAPCAALSSQQNPWDSEWHFILTTKLIFWGFVHLVFCLRWRLPVCASVLASIFDPNRATFDSFDSSFCTFEGFLDLAVAILCFCHHKRCLFWGQQVMFNG